MTDTRLARLVQWLQQRRVSLHELVTGRQSLAACLGTAVGLVLLISLGRIQAPVLDEPAHLLAGRRALLSGVPDWYRVNPPLPKSIAAIPSAFFELRQSLQRHNSEDRPEFDAGWDLFDLNGSRAFEALMLGRLALVPFWLLGACSLFRLAALSGGGQAGCAAVLLWAFNPEIMGWGATICPDMPAAAMTILITTLLVTWLQRPGWRIAASCGIALGFGFLTKFTLLLLIPSTIAVATFQARVARSWRIVCQGLIVLTVALLVFHAGYGFGPTGMSLEPDECRSKSLRAQLSHPVIGSVLVPIRLLLPHSALRGLDEQQYDFEQRPWCSAMGISRRGGWWWWYLLAMFVKLPAGTVLLCFLALALLVTQSRNIASSSLKLLPLLACVLPVTMILATASIKTGMTSHLRYLLPIYPLGFVIISRLFVDHICPNRSIRWLSVALLGWSIASSLWNFPSAISYFNEFAGGVKNGHSVLPGQVMDCGQDAWRVIDRQQDHELKNKPVFLALELAVPYQSIGLQADDLPRFSSAGPPPDWTPPAGHWFVSVNYQSRPEWEWLHSLRPIRQLGGTILEYDVSHAVATSLKRRRALQARLP